MLKITFTIERQKPRPRQAAQDLRRAEQQDHRVHPLVRALLALIVIYCATLTTSLVTGDNSLLIDLTRVLVQFACRLLGIDAST
jgi:hypothetical protein